MCNIFVILFGKEMFVENFKSCKIYFTLSSISAILVLMPYNYYGFDPIEIPEEFKYFRLVSSVIMIFGSFLIYLKTVIVGFQISRQAKNKQIKFSAKVISISFIFLIWSILLLLIDILLFKFNEISAYSYVLYCAWIMIILFIITIYIGLIMPDWIKKRIKIDYN
jgi:hypothetical protein